MEKIKILYLYAEIMPYNIAVIKELLKIDKIEVHIISWDKQKLTPYVPPKIENVFYYKKSDFDLNKAMTFIDNLKPTLVFTSGWMDKFYISIAKKIRKKYNTPVIAFSDTQWYGTLKQNIGRIYFRLFYKSAFSHCLVSGVFQYEYAKKLGFKKHQIEINFLSADLNIFNKYFENTISFKRENYPKTILYAGRFAPVKGLDLLIKAWENIEDKKGWKLKLVGNGDLKNQLLNHQDVEVLDFVQPENFFDLIKTSGAFILPSRKEPWALVLHEFSAAGLPIICSDVCGAAPTFLINGYNGYIFQNENDDDLMNKINTLINKNEDELIKMAINSHHLGQRLDPITSAYKLLSFLNK
jgi:glycosyltransferase involved in cell wall biosynthesis